MRQRSSKGFRRQPIETTSNEKPFGVRVDEKAKAVLMHCIPADSPLKFEPTKQWSDPDRYGVDGRIKLPDGSWVPVDFTVATDREGRLGSKVKRATRRSQPFEKHGLSAHVVVEIDDELADTLNELTLEQIARKDRVAIHAAGRIVLIFRETLKIADPPSSQKLEAFISRQ